MSTLLGVLGQALVHGTAICALTWVASRTVLRGASPRLLAAVWLIVLAKFALPVGPALPFSFSTLVERAVEFPSELVSGAAEGASHDHGWWSSLWQVLPFSYLAVVTWLGARKLLAYIGLRRRVERAPVASDAVHELVRDAARRLGLRSMPSVRAATLLGAPFTVGFWRPVVVLPASMGDGSPGLEAIVLHELAHLRRLDPWSRLLQWGCETVFFFWPPVWFASARLDEARELACDELALRHGSLSPVEYARCLVAVFREARSDQTSLAALAMVSHPSHLEERIDMLLKSKPTASKRIVAGLLLTWSALALAGSPTAAPIGGLGSLDKALIQNVIHDHRAEIKACYESALERSPTTQGTVVVDFTISSQGSVREAVARFSTLSDEVLEGCITASIGGWHFPKPQGAGVVHVSYPFTFSSRDDTAH